MEQILAVPATLLVEQLAEVRKFVSQHRVQQRTLEQISDTPVPHVGEELAALRLGCFCGVSFSGWAFGFFVAVGAVLWRVSFWLGFRDLHGFCPCFPFSGFSGFFRVPGQSGMMD